MCITSILLLLLVACTNMGENAEEGRIIDEDFLEAQEKRFDNFEIAQQEGQLSSQSTTIPSDEFPHTNAVQIQPARYEFIISDSQKHSLPQGTGQLTQNDIEQLVPEEFRSRFQEGNFGQGQVDVPKQSEPVPVQPSSPVQPVAPTKDTLDKPENQEAKSQPEPGSAKGISDIEARVIELTNAERRRNGMTDLEADSPLSHVAREKSNDMQVNNYFSHTSPTYGSPFDMIRDFGVSYSAAGENIAKGQRTAEEVVQAWMDSEGHRANILNGTFTSIGVGYNENGNYWTQMFISK
jgi:uncharacterized YkwD family protein